MGETSMPKQASPHASAASSTRSMAYTVSTDLDGQVFRLVLLNHVVQFHALRIGDHIGGVAPDQTQVAILGEDLFELGLDLGLEALGEIFFVMVGVIPVIGPVE